MWGGGGVVVGKVVDGEVEGGGILKDVLLYARLEPYSKVQVYHTTMVST